MANPKAPWPVRKGIFRSSGQSDFIPTRSPSPIVEMPLSPPPVMNNNRASSLSRFDNNCPLSPPPQPIQVIQGPVGPIMTTAASMTSSGKSTQSSSSSSQSATASSQSSSSSQSASSSAQNKMSQASAASASSSARMSASASSASRSVRKNSLPPNFQQYSCSSSAQQQSGSTAAHNHHNQTHIPKSSSPVNLQTIRQIPIEVEQNKVRMKARVSKRGCCDKCRVKIGGIFHKNIKDLRGL